jgi:hypothetical protein
MSHVVLLKAAKRLAYSAALPILSSDAPYKLLLFRQPLYAITELLKTCDSYEPSLALAHLYLIYFIRKTSVLMLLQLLLS